jgi:mersacidin/lichenicidin family type 2 lantibiotic
MQVEAMIKAWKDEDFRMSLPPQERPQHPAGTVDSELNLSMANPDRAPNTCQSMSSCYMVCSW